MKEFQKWLFVDWMSDGPRTYAIHISHTDLDGYGCHLVTRVAQNASATSHVTNPIYFGNTDYTYVNQEREIDRVIANIQLDGEYRKGYDRLYFLVTDIGRFNPAIFTKYIQHLGHKINWIIIDHHPDVEDYCKLDKMGYDTEGNLIPCEDNRVYNNTSRSATLSLFYEMIMDTQALRDCDRQNMIKALRAMATAISASDTGHWGNWSDTLDRPTPATEALTERMRFAYYEERNMVDLWVNDTLALLPDINQHEFFTHLRDSLKVETRMHTLGQWNRLKVLYHQMDACTRPLEGRSRIKGIGDAVVYEYVQSDDAMGFGNMFSPLSSEWLRAHPEVQMLVKYEPEHDYYSLRSGENGLNCSEIAALNGGGGHPRAAGFTCE